MILRPSTSIYLFLLAILTLLPIASIKSQSVSHADRICGKWENRDKTLRIEIFTVQHDFRARIVWFSDTEGQPMDYWKDTRNPDPKLRSRKILGMSILSDLRYDAENDRWEDGTVYDSRHGKYWNASAYIDKKGILKVRGYWHFKFMGKTIRFHRIR